ncbi:hypothetical protein Tco_0128230 [Tanacetum coccineum]
MMTKNQALGLTSNDEDRDDEERGEKRALYITAPLPLTLLLVLGLSFRPLCSISTFTRWQIGEHLARCTTPPAHSLPPPVPSPLLPSSGCPTQIQTLRITSTQALIDAVTAALPSPPLPPLLPSLYIPPPVDRRDDILESEQSPRKRLCLSTLGSRYEIGESSTARPTRDRGVDYGFVCIVDAEARRQGISEVGVTELAELREHDTQDLYALLEDAQDSRSRLSQRVDMDSQWVDLLMISWTFNNLLYIIT